MIEAQIKDNSTYQDMMEKSRTGQIKVETVFAAIREGRIDNDQAREILRIIERTKTPTWHRSIKVIGG